MSEQADPGGSSAVRRGTTIVLPPVIKAVMKRDWHGRENIPGDGGVIIAPNHLSYADWAAVALFTYQAGRYPFFLIKSSAFDVKLLGPFLRACGQLPVHRDRGDATLVVKELKDAETAPSGSQVTEGVKSAGPVLELARAHGVENADHRSGGGGDPGPDRDGGGRHAAGSRSAKPERYGV